MMIEIVSVEQKEVTDQEVIEAVNTIHRYCADRSCHCEGCVLLENCDYLFGRHISPDAWPEVEVPDD
mgnify:FL=1